MVTPRHSHNFRNLTGERFGRLVVLSYEGRDHRRREALYKVRCDCGEVVVVNGRSLVSGGTRSCGCLRREKSAATAAAICHRHVPVQVIGPDGDIHYYESQRAAAKALGCSYKTVWRCTKTGYRYHGNLIQRAK